jgi:hypothetical protein
MRLKDSVQQIVHQSVDLFRRAALNEHGMLMDQMWRNPVQPSMQRQGM